MAAASILVVCTGNICRSPLAAGLLRSGLQAAGVGSSQVEVTSAGTHALVGRPMDAQSARHLLAHGGDPAPHVASAVTAQELGAADLVLTATLQHRSAVVSLNPRALRRSFTLRELARLLDGADLAALPTDPAERVAALAGLASGRRGVASAAEPGADDVVDPYGGPPEGYDLATAQIVPAVEATLRALTVLTP